MLNKLPDNLACLVIIIVGTSLGIFVTILARVLPDWVAVVTVSPIILLECYVSLRYMVMRLLAGNLLLRIPNNKSLPFVLIIGLFCIVIGIAKIIDPSKPIPIDPIRTTSILKSYFFGVFLISSGIFLIIEKFRYTEIRENGILHSAGPLYYWKNIGEFAWNDTDDKLSLKLRRSYIQKNIKLAISSSYRKRIISFLKKYTKKDYVV